MLYVRCRHVVIVKNRCTYHLMFFPVILRSFHIDISASRKFCAHAIVDRSASFDELSQLKFKKVFQPAALCAPHKSSGASYTMNHWLGSRRGVVGNLY